MEYKIFGYDWSEIESKQRRIDFDNSVDTKKAGDYGADPLGDGTFRMVPSGDIVGWDERQRRLESERR